MGNLQLQPNMNILFILVQENEKKKVKNTLVHVTEGLSDSPTLCCATLC